MSISELQSLINPNILESDPATYYDRLLTAKSDPKNAGALRYIMNDTLSNRTYNAPPVMQLSYMVGTLLRPDPEIEGRTFYGQYTSISDDLGCLILDAMIEAGADVVFLDSEQGDRYDFILQFNFNHPYHLGLKGTITTRDFFSKFKKNSTALRRSTS